MSEFIEVNKNKPVECPYCDAEVKTVQPRIGAPKLTHSWPGWTHTVYLELSCRQKKCGEPFFVQRFEDCLVVSKDAPVVK